MEDNFQIAPKPVTPKPTTTPVMDIKPAATPASDNHPHQPASQKEQLVNHETKGQPVAKTKQPSNGSGAAIIATVIIVIALAALATYAYLKTAK